MSDICRDILEKHKRRVSLFWFTRKFPNFAKSLTDIFGEDSQNLEFQIFSVGGVFQKGKNLRTFSKLDQKLR
jgi:hypothetical protein